jgi:chorismate synthase
MLTKWSLRQSTSMNLVDPCVGNRALPVGEAIVACVVADAFLR